MSQDVVIENMAPVAAGKAMDTVTPANAGSGNDLLFNALLYPNRSLPNGGFIAVMTVLIGFNVLAGLYILFLGAWPWVFFAGADVLGVYIAFKLSYRQGRMHERLIMTRDEFWVARVLPSGHETRWKLQPFWTRVEMERPARHESQLKLYSHGKVLVIGSFLSPAERGELAEALIRALAAAREPVIRDKTAGAA